MKVGELTVKITVKNDAQELLDVCKDISNILELVPKRRREAANLLAQRAAARIKRIMKMETP